MRNYIKKWSTILIGLLLYSYLTTNIAYPVVWPIGGTYPKEIEGDYGPRGVGTDKHHKGLDFADVIGTKVKAVEGGEVVKIEPTGDDRYIDIKGSKVVRYIHVKADGIIKGDKVEES